MAVEMILVVAFSILKRSLTFRSVFLANDSEWVLNPQGNATYSYKFLGALMSSSIFLGNPLNLVISDIIWKRLVRESTGLLRRTFCFHVVLLRLVYLHVRTGTRGSPL